MARDFSAQKGAILQEYLMYFKKLQRICGGKDQPDTEDVFNQWFLKSGRVLRGNKSGTAEVCTFVS